MEELEDKKLYSYKQALNQPYWIQKFNEEFSLSSPVKFSRFVYGGVIVFFVYTLLDKLVGFLPFGLRGMIACLIAFQVSDILANMVVDGKAIIFYIYDYLFFYVKHGMNCKGQYINKGFIYSRPQSKIRKGE